MKISQCSKTYGKRTVLNCPELELEPGRIYAVIGPNGSGKSTYAKLVAGVLKKDGGGTVSTDAGTVRYMPQKSFPFRMSVEKNILLAGGDVQRAADLMKKLHLEGVSRQRAQSLSGGETAKMSLARVLMKPCELLILDEPTSAMDMESAIAAERLIGEYSKETGCAVLFVTHDLSQAKRMATDALFFYHGDLWEMGPAEQLLYDPERPETRNFLEYYGGLGPAGRR